MLAEVFNAAPVPIVITAAAGERTANEAALAAGLDDFAAVVRDDGPDTLAGAVEEASGPNRRSSNRLYTVRRGGANRVFRVNVAPIGDGESGRVLVSAEDVTDVTALDTQRRRFLDAANHQFRTPLSPILGYAELLRMGERDPGFVDEAVGAIAAGARRLASLLDRTAALTRLQAAVPAPTVVVAMGKLISGEVVSRNRDLAVEIHGDPEIEVQCDPASIGLGIFELADNGGRYGVPPVTIAWRVDGGEVVIEVFDAGPGPDLETGAHLDHVWAPVSRTDVMPPYMGPRLGLAAAATLVELGRGRLRFVRDRDRWFFQIRVAVA